MEITKIFCRRQWYFTSQLMNNDGGHFSHISRQKFLTTVSILNLHLMLDANLEGLGITLSKKHKNYKEPSILID